MKRASDLLKKIFIGEWKPEKIWNLQQNQRGWGWNLDIGKGCTYVIGHLPDRWDFKEGDELQSAMVSGKTARFRIGRVHYYSDPPDMLRADLHFIEYTDGSKRA